MISKAASSPIKQAASGVLTIAGYDPFTSESTDGAGAHRARARVELTDPTGDTHAGCYLVQAARGQTTPACITSALSVDPGMRVIAPVESWASCRQAAARFEVSASSAIRWHGLWKALGDAPAPSRRAAIDHLWRVTRDCLDAPDP
jgi:hypothetical protein